MIRQAHTYLAGAMSGTALVGAAIVAFVMLVSLQTLKDWPLTGISLGGDDNAAVAPARPGTGAAAARHAAAGTAHAAGRATAGARGRGARNQRGAGTSESKADVAPVVTPASGNPTTTSPTQSPANQTGPNASSSSPSGSASSGGSNPAGGGGGSTGSGSSGSKSTSGAITGTVNNTVSGVDQATGGVIGGTGVTKASEEVVNGVAGPESTVGQAVDEVTKPVGSLLGDNE